MAQDQNSLQTTSLVIQCIMKVARLILRLFGLCYWLIFGTLVLIMAMIREAGPRDR